jgi:hypothetical protein
MKDNNAIYAALRKESLTIRNWKEWFFYRSRLLHFKGMRCFGEHPLMDQ